MTKSIATGRGEPGNRKKEWDTLRLGRNAIKLTNCHGSECEKHRAYREVFDRLVTLYGLSTEGKKH